ncbi:MAG: 5-deoxy-glucuronate isomerase [Nitrososphaerota archaeon]
MRGGVIRASAECCNLRRLFMLGDFSVYHFRACGPGADFSLPASHHERIAFSTDGEIVANGERLDVRDMLYAPRGSRIEVRAAGRANIYVAEAMGVSKGRQFVKRWREAVRIEAGRDSYARIITLMLGEEDPCDRLLAGYTESVGGTWTGYPPHRHDSKPEAYIYYGMSPGFGVQLLMDEEGEEAYVVRDNDVVFIERGYHPNVGVSINGIKYAWVIAAPAGRRDLSVEVHPLFSSVPMGASHLKIKRD